MSSSILRSRTGQEGAKWSSSLATGCRRKQAPAAGTTAPPIWPSRRLLCSKARERWSWASASAASTQVPSALRIARRSHAGAAACRCFSARIGPRAPSTFRAWTRASSIAPAIAGATISAAPRWMRSCRACRKRSDWPTPSISRLRGTSRAKSLIGSTASAIRTGWCSSMTSTHAGRGRQRISGPATAPRINAPRRL